MFAATSTSVETRRIARVIKVMKRRARISKLISSAGVFNCKQTVGTTLYSAHAFGDAVDFMCSAGPAALDTIAKAVIKDATRPTVANLGRPTRALYVIRNTTQWVKSQGESPYSGVAHTNHVHVGCSFSTHQVPACAGGSNLGVPYVSR